MREHAAAADPARFAIRTATCSAEAYDKFRADVGRHHPSLRSLRSIRTHAHAALRAAAAVAVYAVCAAAVYAAARRRARPAVCAAAVYAAARRRPILLSTRSLKKAPTILLLSNYLLKANTRRR